MSCCPNVVNKIFTESCHISSKSGDLTLILSSWYEEGPEVPLFKSGLGSRLRPPSNSGLQGPLFRLLILHMIPGYSPNGEMDEGHI